jgi:hypothetical protein
LDLCEIYTILRQNFRPEIDEITIPEINARIRNFDFHSDYSFEDQDNNLPGVTEFDDYRFRDHKIKENSDFTYPVFLPDNRHIFDTAIILLHGLNEKNWN